MLHIKVKEIAVKYSELGSCVMTAWVSVNTIGQRSVEMSVDYQSTYLFLI